MRIGVVVPMAVSDGPGQMPTWPQVRTFGQHAEAVGLDSVWVCDHLLSGPPDQGIHEGWTILAALAASTRRVELGQLVTCTSFRHPALLAKMATTADAVSGGRLILGLGAGWYDPEYQAFGYPTDHRVGRFEEAIGIIGPLLRGEPVTLAGSYYQVRDAVLRPPPDRPIPILVAAKGRRMLRLTARHADAWNTAWYGLPDDLLHRRLAELHAALEAEGRDPATLRRTVAWRFGIPTPQSRGRTWVRRLAARSMSSPGRSTLTSGSGSTTSSSSSNRRPRGRWTASPRRSSCGPTDPTGHERPKRNG
jgi:alkanesulfonate monooxygenase SsuD/methylene tetrahydromethanopterin reductase-like flavin-dependent oxidoreductase (luciferase family)